MSCGQGQMGQLGHEDMRDQWTPQLLDPKLKSNVEASIEKSKMFGGQQIKMVSCGTMHSLLLTSGGEVYAFGWGVDGQLGLPKPPKDPSKPAFMQPRFMMPTPTQIESLSGIQSITSGDQFNFAVSSGGTVYSWGANTNGQLGHGNTDQVEQPKRVEALSGSTSVQIACGGCHALALMSDRSVTSWGRGKEGQLGHGANDDVHTPKTVDELGTDIAGISAGGNVSFAWRNFGAPPAPKRKAAPEPAPAKGKKKAKKKK